ncbi:hypothetical protein FGO68_gene3358 [Halteria grandinella]|uniref:Ribosomal protein S21 n=1 Tax=Halteria grandinella TaxID=5974 RepID=A0A8J8T284_HALGN|nr:hypothetical protein FGO68_gene3358 [Halteria grandinella]
MVANMEKATHRLRLLLLISKMSASNCFQSARCASSQSAGIRLKSISLNAKTLQQTAILAILSLSQLKPIWSITALYTSRRRRESMQRELRHLKGLLRKETSSQLNKQKEIKRKRQLVRLQSKYALKRAKLIRALSLKISQQRRS